MTEQAEKRVSIAKEFSRYPGGRLKDHGPYSGEEFRERVLIPLLKEYKRVVIDMTGTIGYGASFLDESFGEAGKQFGYKALQEKLILIADDDPDLVGMVWEKIEKGSQERGS